MTTLGTRHRALDQQQLALRIDADDFQILRRALNRAHMTRHALTGKNTTWILRHTDGARNVMRTGVTMTGATGCKVVTLDRAGETLTLRYACHIDHLADFEHIKRNNRAGLQYG